MSKLSRQLKHKNEVHHAKNFLLIGAPNVGKSTIFNRLTNATSVVSNIDRMTTEHTAGKIKKIKELSYLIDLPGVYNLSHPVAEEYETAYHLIHGKADGIINVISAFSIERDLYLTLQCIETGLLNTLTINMIDLINVDSIDWGKLSKKLNGVNIVLTRSNRNKNTKAITWSISNNKHANPNLIVYSSDIENAIRNIENVLPNNLTVSKRFVALMLLEKNDYYLKQLNHHYPEIKSSLENVLNQYINFNCAEEIRNTKIEFIKKILADCKYKAESYLKVNMTKQQKFDHWFLKKWIGIPAFILISLIIYYLAFGNYAGGWLQSHFQDWLVNTVGAKWLFNLFNNIWHAPQWCTSLFVEGIWGGIAIILPFIVTITILYTCITIIQQIGLLSRVSVLLDNALSKFGLSGRSVINLLTGFGCTVPAVMLARSSSSKKERLISVLIVPFVACTTRVIVLSAIANAVFTNLAWLVTFGLVFFSGLLALLIGLLFSKTMFRKQTSFFCVEMVNWNSLDFRIIVKSVWLQLKEFLKKAFAIVLIANAIIWIFVHIGPKGYVGSSLFSGTEFKINESLLSYIGKVLSYPMYPVFGKLDWKLSASLVAGLPAKEITLTTLTQLADGGKIVSLFAGKFGKALAMSYLVFMLFYLPCVPSMNAIRSEVGIKNMFINLGVSLATAYVLATITYWIGYGICLI